MLFSVEQTFVGRDEIRAPLITPAWEANSVGKKSGAVILGGEEEVLIIEGSWEGSETVRQACLTEMVVLTDKYRLLGVVNESQFTTDVLDDVRMRPGVRGLEVA